MPRAGPCEQPAVALPLAPSVQDPARMDEIARTIYIGNVGPTTREEELIQVFSSVGPVAFVKLAGDPSQMTRFAFLEYVDVPSANNALSLNGTVVGGRVLKCVLIALIGRAGARPGGGPTLPRSMPLTPASVRAWAWNASDAAAE